MRAMVPCGDCRPRGSRCRRRQEWHPPQMASTKDAGDHMRPSHPGDLWKDASVGKPQETVAFVSRMGQQQVKSLITVNMTELYLQG